MIRPLPRGGSILDLGCGGGEPIDRFLIDHGFHVTGVDNAVTQINLARTRFPRERWIRADMRTVIIDEQFDAVIAWGSLSALDEADQTMMEGRAADWLKRGGRFLFDTDDRVGLEEANQSAALARVGLIEMAHITKDSSGGSVWLARKP